MRPRRFLDGASGVAAIACLTVSCGAAPVSSPASPSSEPAVASTAAPSTLGTTPGTTMPRSPATVSSTVSSTGSSTTSTTSAPDLELLADISMTSVPPDVIVPTSEASLDEVTNPINGRRGSRDRSPEDIECADGTIGTCLTGVLDMLGFDVTSGSSAERERRVQRATAVAQLDAGLPVTGVADDALREYLGIAGDATPAGRADDVRRIGTSAQGRPITAMRHGDGPTTVLVVGQTHGDEEGGLRVLLRAQTLPVPDDVTLWFVSTMNPDGARLDTRFLVNGADPNRQAPTHAEQHAVHDFALATRPSLTVWYHQNYGWVGGAGASMAPAADYQSLTALGTLNRSGDCASGFMWCPIDDALGASSILVELPDVVTPADVHAHASALLIVAARDTV